MKRFKKMIFRKTAFMLFISIVVVACNQDGDGPGIVYLECQKAESQEAGKLSELLKDIRYVALETKDTCLLRWAGNVALTDKYIVVDGYESGCLVFDKRNGKYLRTIGMWKDSGPMGYDRVPDPMYVVGNELFLRAENGEKYRAFSLDDGSLLRTISGAVEGHKWASDYLYALNDSTMLHYIDNAWGNREYGLQVGTWSGHIQKRFPSANNFQRDESTGYFNTYPPEIVFYRYNDQVYFHEFTSDTIFRLTDRLEKEPAYVVGKGEGLPVPEMRNEMLKGSDYERLIKFDNILETDRYLLLKHGGWNRESYIYDKRTKKTIRLEGEQAKGFVNDLDGFLPFWPIDRGQDKAQNEVWASLQAEKYIEGVEATGKNPLGKDIDLEDNPIIVIGTLKE